MARRMDLAVILAFVSAIFAMAVALTGAWGERRSVAHWTFAAGMLTFGIEGLLTGLSLDSVSPGEVLRWQSWRLVALSFLPGTWLVFSLSYARGNYREALKRHQVLLGSAFAAPIGLAVLLRPYLIGAVEMGRLGEWLVRVALPGFALNLIFLVSALVVLMNLERTYRAAVGTMRWRIKYMILGLALLFAVRAYCGSQVLVRQALSFQLQTVNAVALLLACLLILRSLMRAGHFETTVYPSRAVLHSSLTLMLAGVYLVIIGVLAKSLGSGASFTLRAFLLLVSLVVLTTVLFSDRARLVTRRFVSRHFQRPEYDYRSVWRGFTQATARQVEQPALCEAVVKLLSQVFQALSVSVWLVDERRQNLTFAASTFLSRSRAAPLALEAYDAIPVILALESNAEPVDLDASKETWAAAARRLHPSQFPEKGGNRVCVPIIGGLAAGDDAGWTRSPRGESPAAASAPDSGLAPAPAARELFGMIILGDRVGGVPYSTQDFDLLRSLSDQVAASLLNIQLSHKLAQAKELEAFQAMSAFFVHDLKNTASTLSLMLRNLPVHFDNPSFREDALRGISKTVTHINGLIGRLSLLRQELSINAAPADLCRVAEEAVKSLPPVAGVDLEVELPPSLLARIDPPRIQSVITNLLLNAREALAGGGRIRLGAAPANGWAVLTVTDNGCGMSPEFVQRSLFRPFQTTKKKGIGIGMFQCKMIVEAHHGRIEAESQPGRGTSFRIFLPLVTAGRHHPEQSHET